MGNISLQNLLAEIRQLKRRLSLFLWIMQAWKALVQSSRVQIHLSRNFDPFLNLSIEHYLLQKSPPDSTVLFLYVNRPCVVIGRNQNPWLEVDLNLLKQPRSSEANRYQNGMMTNALWENVQLVRRRSGGGTVFHDEGNVNYSVICPTAKFTRDKHAEMVTMAIREFNLRARVNERHDIVLDQGTILDEKDWPDPADMRRTVFHPNSEKGPPLKVSGSAYKLTRQRSLHHGTCLLASMDLSGISRYLRSPSQPFIKARGVESVRSPIGNVHRQPNQSTQTYNKSFKSEVIKVFSDLYGIKIAPLVESGRNISKGVLSYGDGDPSPKRVAEDEFNSIEEIQEGSKELQSSKWLYGQTPQFTLSSHANEENERERPPLPSDFPPSARVYLKIRAGAIDSSRVSISADEDSANSERENFDQVLKNKNVHDIDSFNDLLHQAEPEAATEISGISRWLNNMFGKTG